MILEYNKINSDDFYDFCIIGTGPAGLVCASSLSKTNKKIALLEGGGDDWTEESQNLYKGKSVGDPYFELDEARLRFLGGTSNYWGGTCRTLDSYDFEKKISNKLAEWPIKKSDLEKYLDEALKILNLDIKKDGKVFNDIGLKKINLMYSQKLLFKEMFNKTVYSSKNVFVFLDTNVKELSTNGNNIEKVNVINSKNKQKFIKAKYYILATGGIENSRILLWSNIKSNNQVVKNKETLGKYWMEHPQAMIGDAVIDLDNSFGKIVLDSKDGVPIIAPTKNTIDEISTLNYRLKLHKYEYKDNTKKLISDIGCVAPRLSQWFFSKLDKQLVCGYRIEAFWEIEPNANNKIELSEKNFDRFGIPRVNLYYKKSLADWDNVRKIAIHFAKGIAKSNYGRFRFDNWLENPQSYRINEGLNGYHHMGGTRMASSSNLGVVDKNCKVFGQNNLYVAGSSVFPSSGHANPTLSIIQLSLRLADHLSKKI